MKADAVKKICVVLVDRANYGRLRPVMTAIRQDPALVLQTVCAGTMMLERFGNAAGDLKAEGFDVDGCVFLEMEGSLPVTMAKGIGLGVLGFASEFHRLQPDVVLVIGDRSEALAAAIAAVYSNFCLAHIQGGELSGSIDESARHAITKLAHLHFPSTERAARYIVQMGESPAHVFNVGCPSGDYILPLDDALPAILSRGGDEENLSLDPAVPFFLVIFHPVTTQWETQRHQAEQLVQALHQLAQPTLWISPNIDAGADSIAAVLHAYQKRHQPDWLQVVSNLDPVSYQKILKRAACAIGNSSSFIRDSSFTGTPVVLIGDRQTGREHGPNVMTCAAEVGEILGATRRQLAHGRYAASPLYGDGKASQRIVRILKSFVPYPQKRLHYDDDAGCDRRGRARVVG